MEGVTDAPMRAVLSEIGGFTHLVSEFIRVSQNVIPKRVFRSDIPEANSGFLTESGVPVQPQLLGGDPERVALSAAEVIAMGAPGIDLNFGCPAPTVNRNDGGATLLKYPERLEAIVRAVRDQVPSAFPVSAKLRLGWEDPRDIVENAKRAESGGAAWITIHARTKMNGYQPPAYWEWIAKAKQGVSIPVVANGDLWSVEDFRRCREMTGAEHFMIGRSALADPWLAQRLAGELGISTPNPGDLPDRADLKAWLPILKRFTEFSFRYSNRETPSGQYCARRVKQWLRYSESAHGTPWFSRVKRTETLEALFQAIQEESFLVGKE